MGQVDWNKVVAEAEAGPQPVPDGPYTAYVESAEGKMSQNGSPMVVAVFKIYDGPYAGKTIWNNFVLTADKPAALGYFLEHMAALGVSQQDVMALPTDELLAMQTLAGRIIGQYAQLDVGHRNWNGKLYNQVNSVKPYGGSGAAAAAPPPAVDPGPTAPVAGVPVAVTPPPVEQPAAPVTPPGVGAPPPPPF